MISPYCAPDNPWSNAKALAIKAGRVLGILLANRAFGKRPVTLVGYSLGSLVLVEALKYLSTLHVAETMHLIQDVFLFGTPAPTNPRLWSAIRRVVGGNTPLLTSFSASNVLSQAEW